MVNILNENKIIPFFNNENCFQWFLKKMVLEALSVEAF